MFSTTVLMPRIQLNTTDYHVEEAGNPAGMPLLLIAGLASDARSWMPVVPKLGRHCRLIMPDNPGTGRTDPEGHAVDLPAMADDYAALIAQQTDKPMAVLGHSMGAMIALDLAARYPDRVSRLVLAAAGTKVAPPIRPLMRDLADLRTAVAAKGEPLELWYRLFFPWLFAPGFFDDPRNPVAAAQLAAAMPEAQTAKGFAAQVAAVLAADVSDCPGRIRAPTLVLNGALDRFHTGYDREQPFRSMADVVFTILPEAAHSLHWDDPAGFCLSVTGFVMA